MKTSTILACVVQASVTIAASVSRASIKGIAFGVAAYFACMFVAEILKEHKTL